MNCEKTIVFSFFPRRASTDLRSSSSLRILADEGGNSTVSDAAFVKALWATSLQSSQYVSDLSSSLPSGDVHRGERRDSRDKTHVAPSSFDIEILESTDKFVGWIGFFGGLSDLIIDGVYIGRKSLGAQ